MIHVYKFSRKDNDVFDHHEKYVKEHPERYLFSYDGLFNWNWHCIEVDGKYYTFCIGCEDRGYYFVEEYTYKTDMEPLNTYGTAYCPACGYPIDWEQDDGIIKCEQCYSKIEKRTKVEIDYLEELKAGYQTKLIELYKPHKLDNIKALNEV